eukprot:m.203923 g.203923  ORF g.203923 m.203923 type:complete len:332 (+) comp32869_c7_seq1:211-1206(+)
MFASTSASSRLIPRWHRVLMTMRFQSNSTVTRALPKKEAYGSVGLTAANQLTASLAVETPPTGAIQAHRTGENIPLLYHWTAFQTVCPVYQLGRDGHPQRGNLQHDLTIAVPDTWRRMFGGSSIEYHGNILLDQPLRRRSCIDSVVDKTKAGLKLCLVKHDYHCLTTDRLELSETQTLIYINPDTPTTTSASAQTQPKPKPKIKRLDADAPLVQIITPTSVLLFRYSALTFNGHRIHYDADYCRDVEGYDAPVVHGPLLATFLASKLKTPPGMKLERWVWRAVSPVLVTQPFGLHAGSHTPHAGGVQAKMFVVNQTTGAIAVEATATFSPC